MSKSNNESNGSSPWLKGGLAGVAIFSVLLLVIYGLYLTIKAPMGIGDDNTGITWYAQYGDAFGVITSFFTAAGTIGLVGTIILQYQTLKAQKEELSETRKEIAGQREELRKQEVAMIAQVRTMERQQVEATFFRLIDKHKSVVDSLSVKKNDTSVAQIKGRGCLDVINEYVYHLAMNEQEKEIKTKNPTFYDGQVLFCRSIYQVISYVDSSSLSDEDKYSLIKLFRYDLNQKELYIIATAALYIDHQGEPKLRRIIEKYSLLLHFKNLENGNAMKAFEKFEVSAFKRTI